MTGWLAALVALGLVPVLAGLQVLSRSLRVTPVDTLRPGPLVQRPTAARTVAPPPSLSLTEQLVEDATFSRTVAEQRLWPLVVSIARDLDVDPARLRPPDADTRAWLRDMVSLLEDSAG